MISTKKTAQAGMFAAALVLCAGSAWAQESASSQSGMKSNSSASAADKMFVKEALQGGNAEVQLGQLALQKAASDDVKQFGQKMVDDHTKLGDQMREVATKEGITPPSGITMKDKALATKLKSLSGEDFDKAYMQAMVKDHRKDLSDFKKEASSGKDPQIKDAANQGSQVIAEHLRMAEQIAQKHNVTVSQNQ